MLSFLFCYRQFEDQHNLIASNLGNSLSCLHTTFSFSEIHCTSALIILNPCLFFHPLYLLSLPSPYLCPPLRQVLLSVVHLGFHNNRLLLPLHREKSDPDGSTLIWFQSLKNSIPTDYYEPGYIFKVEGILLQNIVMDLSV